MYEENSHLSAGCLDEFHTVKPMVEVATSGYLDEFHTVKPMVEVATSGYLDEFHTIKPMVLRESEVPRGRDLGVPR